MLGRFKSVADSSGFQNFITAVIILAGVLVGVETYAGFAARHATTLHLLDQLVLAIFVGEIMIKMGAEGRRPWRYFRDSWNVFDFIIVAACFMPVGSQYVTVLRLARLLRVLKLVRALPRLQLLVAALLKSIPSMGYVSLLLGMLFYVYAVAGVFLFSENDPVRFPDLQAAMLSLFRIVTLEDWTDIMYTQIYGCQVYGFGVMEELCQHPKPMPVTAVLYFVTFVLLGTMVVLNLFIGVIMNGMQEAQNEARDETERLKNEQLKERAPTLEDQLVKLQERLAEMNDLVGVMARRAGRELAAELRAGEEAAGDESDLAPAAE